MYNEYYQIKERKAKRRYYIRLTIDRIINLILALFQGAVIYRCLVYLRERGETLPFVTIPIPNNFVLLIAVGILTILGYIGMRYAREKCNDIAEWIDKENNTSKILASFIVFLFFMLNMFLLIFLPPYFYILTCTFEDRYTDLYGTVTEVGETKAIEGVIPFHEPIEYNFYTIEYEYEGKTYTTVTSSQKEFDEGDEVRMTLNHFCPEKCSISNSISLTQGHSEAETTVMLILLIAPVILWRFFFTGDALHNVDVGLGDDDD